MYCGCIQNEMSTLAACLIALISATVPGRKANVFDFGTSCNFILQNIKNR